MSTPTSSSRLDATLGRYAVAATAALSAASSADAAITLLYGTDIESESFSLGRAEDNASFGFSVAGVDLVFKGVRSAEFSTFTVRSDSSGNPILSSSTTFSSGRIQAGGAGVSLSLNNGYIAKLSSGALINGFAAAGGYQNFFSTLSGFFSGTAGGFNPGVNGQDEGMIGFRIEDAVGALYVGWLNVNISRDARGRPLGLYLAPLDRSGVMGAFVPLAEAAGFTAGQLAAVPEPATAATGLGVLALGAAGLRRRRALLAGRN